MHFIRLFLCTLLICPWAGRADQWYKGNLHTHSFWSDGDDFPEMIVKWYQDNGYHFLTLSDHNILSQGEKWVPITNEVRRTTLQKYKKAFPNLVVSKEVESTNLVKLTTFPILQKTFNQSGQFLLIQSEELSDRYKVFPVHINVTHIQELVLPQGGDSVYEVIQRNMDVIQAQRKAKGVPIMPHLNHPNFGWGVRAEDLARVKGEKFFEVYNGHPQVYNEGDSTHAGMDKIWDVCLVLRLQGDHFEPLYGVGTDDSHNYHSFGVGKSNSGRGWVMVKSRRLDPGSLIEAMEKGDFYATSGVHLTEVKRGRKEYRLKIEGEKGVTYRTQFIGTRRGFDPANEPYRDATGNALPVTHRYSKDVGAVLAEVEGVEPSYRYRGDELYVRAKVISSVVKENPSVAGETETAWAQPYFPKR